MLKIGSGDERWGRVLFGHGCSLKLPLNLDIRKFLTAYFSKRHLTFPDRLKSLHVSEKSSVCRLDCARSGWSHILVFTRCTCATLRLPVPLSAFTFTFTFKDVWMCPLASVPMSSPLYEVRNVSLSSVYFIMYLRSVGASNEWSSSRAVTSLRTWYAMRSILSPGGTPCKIFGSDVSLEYWVQYWLVLGVVQRPHCYNVWKIIMAFAAVCWSLLTGRPLLNALLVGVYSERPKFFSFQQYNNHMHVLVFLISRLHSEGILFYLTTRMNLHSDIRVKAGNATLAATDVSRRLHDSFQRFAFNVRLLLDQPRGLVVRASDY
jgi:hypothetical protein